MNQQSHNNFDNVVLDESMHVQHEQLSNTIHLANNMTMTRQQANIYDDPLNLSNNAPMRQHAGTIPLDQYIPTPDESRLLSTSNNQFVNN